MTEQAVALDIEGDLQEVSSKLKTYVKGDRPINLEQKCLSLCQQFLGGNWAQLSIEDIEIRRLTSGMSNQTYHCKIGDNYNKDNNEPQEVVIRLYGTSNTIAFKPLEFNGFSIDFQMDEGIVSLMASKVGIGPKVYGLFKTGQVMKYYQHRHFVEGDLYDQGLLDQLACKLAQFHAMTPPLIKGCCKLMRFMTSFNTESDDHGQKRQSFAKYNCKTLLDCDLKAEFEWLSHEIKSSDSPVVFSHNDFRFANNMVTEDNQIVLSDFEISSYFNRGYDFGSLFNGFEKLDENSFEFKDESIVKAFIRCYVREGEKLFGKQYSDNKINSVEHIFMETKVFTIVNSMVMVKAMTNNELWQFPFTEKTCLTLANQQLSRYLTIKKSLKDLPC